MTKKEEKNVQKSALTTITVDISMLLYYEPSFFFLTTPSINQTQSIIQKNNKLRFLFFMNFLFWSEGWGGLRRAEVRDEWGTQNQRLYMNNNVISTNKCLFYFYTFFSQKSFNLSLFPMLRYVHSMYSKNTGTITLATSS